jgi:ethanolamine utilization microcompartment shell protein EutL
MATEQFSGPIDFVVFAFDAGADVGPGLQAVLDRVDQGLIEILDVDVVGRDAHGAPVKLELSALTATGVDIAAYDGAGSDILDTEDLATVVADLDEGQFALAIVYEDRSLAAAAQAWTAAGGVELLIGGIAVADLEAALEQTDA